MEHDYNGLRRMRAKIKEEQSEINEKISNLQKKINKLEKKSNKLKSKKSSLADSFKKCQTEIEKIEKSDNFSRYLELKEQYSNAPEVDYLVAREIVKLGGRIITRPIEHPYDGVTHLYWIVDFRFYIRWKNNLEGNTFCETKNIEEIINSRFQPNTEDKFIPDFYDFSYYDPSY